MQTLSEQYFHPFSRKVVSHVISFTEQHTKATWMKIKLFKVISSPRNKTHAFKTPGHNKEEYYWYWMGIQS